MTDFSRFPAISQTIANLGGIKETKFNKKAIAEMDSSWAALSEQEIMMIDQSLPSGKKVINMIVVPTAILVYRSHALVVFPTKDIIWMYPHIVTQKMNFIPTSKMHSIRILFRSGNVEVSDLINTGGFSKKTPADDALAEIANIVKPSYPGIYIGWSDEIANAASNNFPALVASVDQNNAARQ